MLRIMGGEAKGRLLWTPPKTPLIRPILTRIKKSLFDIIRHRLAGCRFLDLYAGSGSVGLEAISQGAQSCVFVETEPMSLKVITKNLEHLGFSGRGTVVRIDASGSLSTLGGPFDVIFMGPPYRDLPGNRLALTEPTLLNIEKANLLTPDGLVVAQHHKKEAVKEPSPYWHLKRREVYGDSVLSFFVRKP